MDMIRHVGEIASLLCWPCSVSAATAERCRTRGEHTLAARVAAEKMFPHCLD